MTSAGRVLLIPKGNYDDSATYTMLDMVTVNFSTYVAKKMVSGISPLSDTTEEYWMRMTGDAVMEQDVQDAFDYVFGTTETSEETTQGTEEGDTTSDIEGGVEQTDEPDVDETGSTTNTENIEEGGDNNE